jgi:hypothetical protein
LSVAIKDPDDIVSTKTGTTLAADGSGAVEFETTGQSNVSVSSVLEFDLTGSTASTGAMTITLPYDASAVDAGNGDEANLKVAHYVGNEWVIENNCTVDTASDSITCIVDTVE